MKVHEHWKYTFLLTWICFSFIIAIFFFTDGLLLHREELPYRSVCRNNTSQSYIQPENIHEQHCSSTSFRVILIIIDALRYDFVAHINISKNEELPYQNKLPAIHNILRTKPKNSKLFKFIADPPTTTMQRIKALTTGCLSTFIDLGSNFASSEIQEDNLIDILNRESKKVVFMGDDTWTNLYPDRFIRSYPFDSFNVWDLDSVDEGVKQNLFPELKNNDWDLLIGHFLGVDHCGHYYGPIHSEMARKLNEMNEVLKNLLEEIQTEENTLLFVIGDHGMTSTGDHGGDTENEVSSAIFVYSPIHPLFQISNHTVEKFHQVNIVPTLSSILGLPIPFSNVGSIVLECVPIILVNSVTDVSILLWKNIEQITTYIRKYSQHNSQFTSQQLESILKYYINLKKVWDNEDIPSLLEKYQIYMKNVLEICQQVWVRFNETSIFCGLISTLMISIFVFIISKIKRNVTVLINYRFLITFFIIFAFVLTNGILWAEYFSSNLIITLGTFTELFFISTMIWLCIKLKKTIRRVLSNYRLKVINLCASLIYFICLAIPFSNSFVLEEPKIIMYLFLTLLWFLTISNLSGISNARKFFTSNLVSSATCLSIIYRIVLSYAKCRGEEDYQCRIAEPPKVTLLSCLLAVFLCIYFYKFYKSYFQEAQNCWILGIICTFISFYWICEFLVINVETEFVYVKNIPGFLLIFLSIVLCVTFYNPLLNGFIIPVEHVSSHSPYKIFDICFTNVHIILSFLCVIILGQLYAVPAVLIMISIWYLASFTNVHEYRKNSKYDLDVPWSNVMLWSLSSVYWFHTTGHNMSFSGIQWNAAFLIQKEIGSNTLLPGILVGLHTFISQAIHSLFLMLLLISSRSKRDNETDKRVFKLFAFQENAFTLIMKYLTLLSIRIFFVMLATYIHRRHLMMWAVFAPKFIFEGISFMFIVIPFSFIGYLFTLRISRQLETKKFSNCI